MPIVAKESSEKVCLSINEVNILEKHSKHSDFHESILSFWIKNGFITEKQCAYIDKCNHCDEYDEYEDDGYWFNFGW
jgi:hypothetical protein